jgi:hypothetical protein
MKKSILAIAVILNCSFIIAQTEFDAMKFVQNDINGTARYMSMAGAFGALGGDVSAIKDNPAGLGIYRSSEMTGTLNMMSQSSNSTWNLGIGTDKMNGLGFNSFAYVKANPTFLSENSSAGLLSSNWSFSYNRLKSFDRNSTIKGSSQNSSMTDYMAYFTGNITSNELTYSNDPYNNTNIPWISEVAYQGFLINEGVNSSGSYWGSLLGDNEQVTPNYFIQERGHVDEYSIGWAGNFSNSFFFGATLNLQSVNYNLNSQYSENFGAGGGMTLNNTLTTSGSGFNLNVGAIYHPIDMLRLGVSVHSPTLLNLTDNNYANLDYYFSNTNNGNFSTPEAYNSYMLLTPWKFNGSAAIIIGTKGLISAEYDYSLDANSMFLDENGNSQNYSDENTGIKTMLQNVKTLKIGAEYKLNNNFSLRAGYAKMTAETNPLADKLMRYNTTRTDTEYFINNGTNYITAGIGYHQDNWYLDLAYMNKTLSETFYPYNSNNLTYKVNPASVSTNTNNLAVTIGFRF